MSGTGLAVHEAGQGLVEPEGDGDRHLHDEVDPEDGERGERDAVGDREDGGAEERGDEAHQGGHLEADVLGEVVVELPAVLHGTDDGGEVVVGEDHHRGVLGHLGAGDAHGHADVGLLERRGVVHAVAGHRHDVVLLLEGVDQADLVLRGHSGDHAELGEPGGELLVGEGGELRAGEGVTSDAQLLADGRRGDGVVAGDHPDLDAGAVALGDGGFGLGAGRIDDADHRDDREVVHLAEQVAAQIELGGIEVPAGHDHDPFARCGHPLVLGDRGGPVVDPDVLRVTVG